MEKAKQGVDQAEGEINFDMHSVWLMTFTDHNEIGYIMVSLKLVFVHQHASLMPPNAFKTLQMLLAGPPKELQSFEPHFFPSPCALASSQ